jgi:hypothetical protein
MDWLATSRLHGIAKRYAHGLPKFLNDAYLASTFYTRPQIDHAVDALGLPKDYIGLAYAAYLPEVAYNEAHTTLPIPMSYEDARREYFRHVPEAEPTPQWNPLTITSLGYQ